MSTWQQQVKEGFARLTEYAGVIATYTDNTGIVHTPKVLYAEPTQSIDGGMQQTDEHSIEYDPDLLPGLQDRSTLSINNQKFRVRAEPMKTEDGFTYRATLTIQD